MNKTVNYRIVVPEGDCCRSDENICQYYDNEGGHSTCDLGFHSLKDDYDTCTTIKPDCCKNLKKAE